MYKILIFVALFMFIGCSSQPSNSNIKEQLTKMLKEKSADKIFKIENLKKLNHYALKVHRLRITD